MPNDTHHSEYPHSKKEIAECEPCATGYVTHKKIQFFSGVESLIEKTDVQPIMVESDKYFQDVLGTNGGSPAQSL